MPHLTISHLEAELTRCAAKPEQFLKDKDGKAYLYCETGRYKSFMPATLTAAKRRGHRVVRAGQGVFYVYPKDAAALGQALTSAGVDQ